MPNGSGELTDRCVTARACPPSIRRGTIRRRAVISALAALFSVCFLAGVAEGSSPHQTAQLAQARKALLVLGDMAKGWKSSKSSNNNSPTPDAAQLAACLGVPVSVVNDNPPTVYSPDFNGKDDLQTVDDSIEVFPSAKAARDDLATASSPKAPGCLTANFNTPAAKSQLMKVFGAGTKVGTAVVTRTPSADYAPHTTNITIYMPITTHGETLNLETTEVGFVKGDEEQILVFESVQTPFPTALSRRLTALAYKRL